MLCKKLSRLLQSKKALAIPVTYLILFVSLLAIVSATYSLAVVRISARGAILKASVAKRNMQALDDAVRAVAWSFGASEVVYMDHCGGIFKTLPEAKNLILNFTDGQTFYEVAFNSSVGKALYELEPSELNYEGYYLRGDERTLIGQSAFTMTQLYFGTGENAKELTLCYRPFVATAETGTINGKPLNTVRVYIINLNSSQSLTLEEKFYLKVTAINITTTTSQYNFNQSVSSLLLKAVLDGVQSTVTLSISSSDEGAIVNLEIVTCNIKIQKAEV
ncbi:MAG: hypothetical protein ACUVT9_04375 [Candidatus Bathycorpusculaceae bacterium]